MEITNAMIYEMLMEFKADTQKCFEQIDQRFEQIDQRFEQIDQRFGQVEERLGQVEERLGQVEKRLDSVEQQSLGLEQRFEMLYDMLKEFKADTNRRLDKIEAQQLEDRRILMNLWEYRDNMKLSFTRTLLTVTGLVSGVVAVIVSFITGKAIILKS